MARSAEFYAESGSLFHAGRKRRSDAFCSNAANVAKVEAVWHENTQASSNTSDIKWDHKRDRGNHRLLCAQCAAPKGDPSCTCVPAPELCAVCAAPKDGTCDCEQEANGRRVRRFRKRWHGKSTCLCRRKNARGDGTQCNRPHRRDLTVDRRSEACDCEDHAEFPCRNHVAHFQLRTNAEMYELFKVLEPDLAESCHQSTFILLKPYYVVPPTRRTCTCTYHNEARMFMEDGEKAHEALHKDCGTEAGCQCDFCKDGACKKSDMYYDYHNLQKLVCCDAHDDDPGSEDVKYECAKGVCGKCGWYELLDFDVPRGHSLNSIGIELDQDMYVTRVLDGPGLFEKPAKEHGVKVGYRLWMVNGRLAPTKTALDSGMKANGNSQQRLVRLRFQKTDCPRVALAACPLETSGDQKIQHRYYGTVSQPRARPKHNADGSVILENQVRSILHTESTRADWHKNMRETMEDFFWHARLAHHQERAFNNAIDNLPANGILILTDYSMNYSHEHQDAEGAEWWSPYQSTLLPVVTYTRDEHGVVWAESRCYMSPDSAHDAAFWQHCADETIDYYKNELQKRGIKLKHVHIW